MSVFAFMLTLAGLFWVAGIQEKLAECHQKQITLANPPPPCKQLRFKKKKREREKKFLSHEYANMQRGVSACLKKCCFCFQQLIVQTTALSPSLCLSFCLPLSFCLSVFLTWSMNMVNRLDPALSSPSSLDGLRLAMEIENA